MHIVYGIQSLKDSGRFYVGLTDDLGARLRQHNSGKSPHTAKFGPWKLVVTIQFADERKAADFEAYLKSGSGRAFAKRHF